MLILFSIKPREEGAEYVIAWKYTNLTAAEELHVNTPLAYCGWVRSTCLGADRRADSKEDD